MNQKTSPGVWDWRWPDPVALKVAAERLLRALPPSRPDLNPRIPIWVQMLTAVTPEAAWVQAVLLSPWAAEKVYWPPPGSDMPPIQSAFPLECDDSGRILSGQGVLLTWDRFVHPVVINWEPETGHYFTESLIQPVERFISLDQLLRAAIGLASPTGPKPTLITRLSQPVSRRRLFHW